MSNDVNQRGRGGFAPPSREGRSTSGGLQRSTMASPSIHGGGASRGGVFGNLGRGIVSSTHGSRNFSSNRVGNRPGLSPLNTDRVQKNKKKEQDRIRRNMGEEPQNSSPSLGPDVGAPAQVQELTLLDEVDLQNQSVATKRLKHRSMCTVSGGSVCYVGEEISGVIEAARLFRERNKGTKFSVIISPVQDQSRSTASLGLTKVPMTNPLSDSVPLLSRRRWQRQAAFVDNESDDDDDDDNAERDIPVGNTPNTPVATPLKPPIAASPTGDAENVEIRNLGDAPQLEPRLECANCGRPGHEVIMCIWARADGFVHGCPIHNTESHSIDECRLYKEMDLADQVQHVFTNRQNFPMLYTEQEGHLFTKVTQLWSLDTGMNVPVCFPWTCAFASAKTASMQHVKEGWEQARDFDALPSDPEMNSWSKFTTMGASTFRPLQHQLQVSPLPLAASAGQSSNDLLQAQAPVDVERISQLENEVRETRAEMREVRTEMREMRAQTRGGGAS